MHTLWISAEAFWEATPCLHGLYDLMRHWGIPAVKIPPYVRSAYFNKRIVRLGLGPAQSLPDKIHYSTNTPWVCWLVVHSSPDQQELATGEWWKEARRHRPLDAEYILGSSSASEELKERVLKARYP